MAGRFDTLGEWCGEGEGYKCGYCKNTNTSFSTGIYLVFTSAERYNRLIDRGWRRSGKYLYKPSMDKTCCPQYTIKCSVEDFHPSRSQRKVLKNFEHFLEQSKAGDVPVKKKGPRESSDSRHEQMMVRPSNSSSLDSSNVVPTGNTYPATAPQSSVSSTAPLSNQTNNDHVTYKTALQMSGSNKKRDFRRLRKLKKVAKEREVEWQTLDVRDFGPVPSLPTFRDRIDKILQNSRFQLKLVKVGSEEYDATFAESHAVYSRYQATIHGDSPDECTQKRYTSFLCNSPFQQRDRSELGAFHQQYWLDGRLIAVGVLDILPRCLSSVYFFYHPSFDSLTLGTLSALFELHLANKLTLTVPSLKWYYMGFYIHSCPKMRYKGLFKPSFLLCPKGYTWWAIEGCLAQLDKDKYCEFDPYPQEEEGITDVERSNQVVISPGDWQAMQYEYYVLRMGGNGEYFRDIFPVLFRLTGRANARNICLITDDH